MSENSFSTDDNDDDDDICKAQQKIKPKEKIGALSENPAQKIARITKTYI